MVSINAADAQDSCPETGIVDVHGGGQERIWVCHK